MTRKVHTFTLTFEVFTNKAVGEISRHILDIEDELAGMLDQDTNDSTDLVSVQVENWTNPLEQSS
jgi:hypothetical protein